MPDINGVAIRIRRMLITPVIEHYDAAGLLLKSEHERPVEMCEKDFDAPVRMWLIARGVPPQVLGAALPQPQSPHPETTSTSSTIAGDILLPHQYATVADEHSP